MASCVSVARKRQRDHDTSVSHMFHDLSGRPEPSEPEHPCGIVTLVDTSATLLCTSVLCFSHRVMEQHLIAPDFDLKSFLNSVLSIDATQVLHSIFSFFTACFFASVRIRN